MGKERQIREQEEIRNNIMKAQDQPDADPAELTAPNIEQFARMITD